VTYIRVKMHLKQEKNVGPDMILSIGCRLDHMVVICYWMIVFLVPARKLF